jgi:hypothetical protein
MKYQDIDIQKKMKGFWIDRSFCQSKAQIRQLFNTEFSESHMIIFTIFNRSSEASMDGTGTHV